jgi:hypothetical protein
MSSVFSASSLGQAVSPGVWRRWWCYFGLGFRRRRAGGGGRTESASLYITGRPGGRGRVAVYRVVAGGRWRVAQNRIKKSPYSPISQHKKAGGGQHGPWALGFGPVGRGRWAVWRVRLENPLGHGNFLSGLKLSGKRDGGLGLARFSVVCPLGGHMYANGL